jgi:hypothetical protein
MNSSSDRRELQDIQAEVDEEKPHHYCIRCLTPAWLSSDPDMCAICFSTLTKKFPDVPKIPKNLFKAEIKKKIDDLKKFIS